MILLKQDNKVQQRNGIKVLNTKILVLVTGAVIQRQTGKDKKPNMTLINKLYILKFDLLKIVLELEK